VAAVRYRTIDEIKETLENAKKGGRGCALLIGAGCSFKAGIPTASGFVDIIKAKYKLAYERAPEKTYPSCMQELLLSERRDLIVRLVDRAKVNWAHLCIARLIEERYIDRVLTTNFDPLVVRACAMLGVFPAVYDFASSQLLKEPDIPDQAVFYLHGQRTGFVLMNTKEEVDKHSKLLRPVFEEAGNGRVWIVVGYSGENDPVFNHLARIPRFDNGLFWIGYQDREPATHVREKLLTPRNKDAFFTRGFDADSFFVRLTRSLGIFPPDLFSRPFSYLQKSLEDITPFTDPGQASEDDVMRLTRQLIGSAIEQYESPALALLTEGNGARVDTQVDPDTLMVAVRHLLMQGRYEQVLAFRKDYEEAPTPEMADMLSKAHVMYGNQLLDLAKALKGEEASRLFAQAKDMYASALAIKPDRHEALHNTGNLLLDLAKAATGAEAEQLFIEAEDKYRAALTIKADLHDVLINWGNLLLDRAKTKLGEAAEELFAQAQAKYENALRIKPNSSDALGNWGNLLLDWGKTRTGEEADRLFGRSQEKYKEALALKPERYDVLAQWGNLLLDWARTKTAAEADDLFSFAANKYEAALAIKPDLSNVRRNLEMLRRDQAKINEHLEIGRASP